MLCVATTAWAQGLTINNGANLGSWPAGPMQVNLSASGGSGGYTWSLTSGALPTGVHLRQQVLDWMPPGTTDSLVGVATVPGPYSFRLTVQDSLGATAFRDFTVLVTTLTNADRWSITTEGFTGQLFDYPIQVLNPIGPVTFSANGPMPPGLSVTSDGHIRGTPTAPGFYDVNFLVTSGGITIGRGVHVSIYRARIDTPGMLPNATVGAGYQQLLSASGGTAPYHWASFNLPFGAALADDGTFTATFSSPGNYRFTVNITDSAGNFYNRISKCRPRRHRLTSRISMSTSFRKI